LKRGDGGEDGVGYRYITSWLMPRYCKEGWTADRHAMLLLLRTQVVGSSRMCANDGADIGADVKEYKFKRLGWRKRFLMGT